MRGCAGLLSATSHPAGDISGNLLQPVGRHEAQRNAGMASFPGGSIPAFGPLWASMPVTGQAASASASGHIAGK